MRTTRFNLLTMSTFVLFFELRNPPYKRGGKELKNEEKKIKKIGNTDAVVPLRELPPKILDTLIILCIKCRRIKVGSTFVIRHVRV